MSCMAMEATIKHATVVDFARHAGTAFAAMNLRMDTVAMVFRAAVNVWDAMAARAVCLRKR